MPDTKATDRAIIRNLPTLTNESSPQMKLFITPQYTLGYSPSGLFDLERTRVRAGNRGTSGGGRRPSRDPNQVAGSLYRGGRSQRRAISRTEMPYFQTSHTKPIR